MNPSLERDLLRLQLKSDAELAAIIRRAERQRAVYGLCGLVIVIVLCWAVLASH